MKTLEVFHVAFEEEPSLVATLVLDGESKTAPIKRIDYCRI